MCPSSGGRGGNDMIWMKKAMALCLALLLVCGADGLIKAAAKLSLATGVPGYVSTESRMGCGVGACLVCACAVKAPDGSVVHKRACADGPVFSLEELVL